MDRNEDKMENNIISIITDDINFYNQILHFLPPSLSYKISHELTEKTILIISDGIYESFCENSDIPIFIIADEKPDIHGKLYYYKHGEIHIQQFINDFCTELSVFQNEERHKNEIKHLKKEIEACKDTIEDYKQNLKKSQEVQNNIMTNIKLNGYDTYVLYKPLNEVSGDLFLAEDFGDKTYIMIGDVVNHGYFSGLYGASLYSLAKSYLMTTARFQMDIVDWARFMQRTSSIYQCDTMTKQLEAATILFCEIDRLSNKARFLNCGHGSELPILISKHGKEKAKFIEFSKVTAPIGSTPASNLNDYVIEINFCKNNGLIFYSDGIPETFQSKEENIDNSYSKERMLSAVKAELDKGNWNSETIVNSVINDLKSYSLGVSLGTKSDINGTVIENVHDDITMACIYRIEE